jgi:hypothetical protein
MEKCQFFKIMISSTMPYISKTINIIPFVAMCAWQNKKVIADFNISPSISLK